MAWSNLAKEVAASEFPEFEVLACFKVFKLAPVATNGNSHLPCQQFKPSNSKGLQKHSRWTVVQTCSSKPWSINELPRPTKFLVNLLLHRGSVP